MMFGNEPIDSRPPAVAPDVRSCRTRRVVSALARLTAVGALCVSSWCAESAGGTDAKNGGAERLANFNGPVVTGFAAPEGEQLVAVNALTGHPAEDQVRSRLDVMARDRDAARRDAAKVSSQRNALVVLVGILGLVIWFLASDRKSTPRTGTAPAMKLQRAVTKR